MKTREEEIRQMAKSYTQVIYSNLDDFSDITDAYVDGAKWADETMIEKACSWLDRALDNFYIGTHQAKFVDKLKFIESFKKAMRNNYETLDCRFRRVGSV